jgi:tetratricopeptide (TPR) repeat protein
MNVKPACHAFAVCCFVLFLLLSPSLNSQSANDDDARLRVLVERFFAAYHRKDLNDFMGLWSPKSPQYASRKKAMQELFAAGNYTFANVTIPTVKVEGEVASLRANLRAVFDMTITNQSPQKSRKERLVRDLVFVREDGAWKIWSYGSPLRELEDLASKLIEKKTEEERTSLLRERGDLVTSDLVMALGQQGNLSYLRGDYQQARGIYQLAGSVAEQIGDKLGIANSRSSVANVLLEQGEYEQAREYFEQGLSQYEAWGDKSRVASAWNNLGIVYERQGNYAKAAECYQKSLTAQEAKEDVSALANMGNILTRQGNYPQALNYYQRCLKHYEDEKDDAEITRRLRSARMAVVLNNIGVVYGLQKHYLQALAHFQQGLELSRTSGDMPGVATALNNVGLIRVLQNEYAQALEPIGRVFR